MEFNYICSECGKNFPIGPEIMVCPDCSPAQEPDQPLRGVLEVQLHGEAEPGADIPDLLPVEREFLPPIPVGNTPLWEPVRVRRKLGLDYLFIKDDGLNPTCSLKDRASYLVSGFAAKNGIKEIVLASTGNAGSSMAGVGAAAGQQVTLFLPETAPKAKLVQALQYGAKVHRVAGSYDQASDLSTEYSTKFGGMSRNTAYNPMTLEGKKTVALEIALQLTRVPDKVFLATGDGCILSGVYKGFRDLVRLGLSPAVPEIISVQAQGSDALYRAFRTGRFEPKPTKTIADSICVDVPRNGFHALNQLREFGGRVLTVTDKEILTAQAYLARSAGLFTEPAGAAAMAGLLKMRAELKPDEVIVVLATGNGLKDIAAAGKAVTVPEQTIGSLNDLIGR